MNVPLINPALLKNQGYINGIWVVARDHTVFPVTNPATSSLIAEVADMGGAET